MLHRLVYLIAALGVLHFWWMVKRDITEPGICAVILAVLLPYRVVASVKEWGGPARLPARGRPGKGGRVRSLEVQ